MSTMIQPFNAETTKNASILLAAGKLVCFPTETVYALAADATNNAAVAAIYDAKARSQDKPLALLLHSIPQVKALCNVDMRAEFLLSAFLPGPLTLVLPLRKGHTLSPLVNKDKETIGVRIPDHPVAQAILRSVSFPVIGTSANIAGGKPAVTAHEAAQALGQRVPLFIEGGEDAQGVASTVLDLTQSPPCVLREGGISKQQLVMLLKEEIR